MASDELVSLSSFVYTFRLFFPHSSALNHSQAVFASLEGAARAAHSGSVAAPSFVRKRDQFFMCSLRDATRGTRRGSYVCECARVRAWVATATVKEERPLASCCSSPEVKRSRLNTREKHLQLSLPLMLMHLCPCEFKIPDAS